MPPPRTAANKRKATVLLTGFGDFSRITENPSWEIVRGFIEPQTVVTADGHRITIVAHPEAVRVAYAAVDALVPQLWAARAWDYVLHVGVGFEGGFQLETRAWQDGYVLRDVDGETPGSAHGVEMRGVHGGEGGAAGRTGKVLETGIDVAWVVAQVAREVKVWSKGCGASGF